MVSHGIGGCIRGHGISVSRSRTVKRFSNLAPEASKPSSSVQAHTCCFNRAYADKLSILNHKPCLPYSSLHCPTCDQTLKPPTPTCLGDGQQRTVQATGADGILSGSQLCRITAVGRVWVRPNRVHLLRVEAAAPLEGLVSSLGKSLRLFRVSGSVPPTGLSGLCRAVQKQKDLCEAFIAEAFR